MVTGEIVENIHRIEFEIDGKLHAFHLLESDHGIISFDTGVTSTPTEHFAPYLEDQGYGLKDIRLVVFTHADADHIGGNATLRNANPEVVYAAHEADVPLIESVDRIMRDRYSQFESYGVEYGDETVAWLEKMLPESDEPVNLGLRGGEMFSLSDGREIQLYHAPGHTAGHLVAYDRTNDVLIGGDVIYPEGAFDVDGNYLQPPPYTDADAYLRSIDLLEGLDPSTLLLTHFEPLHGTEVSEFLARARDWAVGFEGTLESILRDTTEPLTVPDFIDEVVARRGSFGLDLDLAFPITSHLARLQRKGRVVEYDREEPLPTFEPR